MGIFTEFYSPAKTRMAFSASALMAFSAAQILHAVASYLILERMAAPKEEQLAVRLDAYVNEHYTEKLSAEKIAQDLKVGKTQLYELSRELYGCGIAQKIRALRIEKAKSLLFKSKDLPLSEVAFQCGFEDYNYFITVFRREVGLSPAVWRRKNSGSGISPGISHDVSHDLSRSVLSGTEEQEDRP